MDRDERPKKSPSQVLAHHLNVLSPLPSGAKPVASFSGITPGKQPVLSHRSPDACDHLAGPEKLGSATRAVKVRMRLGQGPAREPRVKGF